MCVRKWPAFGFDSPIQISVHARTWVRAWHFLGRKGQRAVWGLLILWESRPRWLLGVIVSPVYFEYGIPPVFPSKELGHRVHLVVVFPVGELEKFGLEILQPGGALGKKYLLRFNLGGLGAHSGNFVAFRLDANRPHGAFRPKILEELGTRGRILDQHHIRIELSGVADHSLFEIRITKTLPEHVYEVIILSLNEPGRAHGKIVELPRLGRRVPALYDLVVGWCAPRILTQPECDFSGKIIPPGGEICHEEEALY